MVPRKAWVLETPSSYLKILEDFVMSQSLVCPSSFLAEIFKQESWDLNESWKYHLLPLMSGLYFMLFHSSIA